MINAKFCIRQALLFGMNQKSDLRFVIAANIAYFMGQPTALYKNANAIATKAKIASNTVRNILEPKRRTTTTDKPDGYPTLDKLEAIAKVLGCETWQLLHPNIERAIVESEIYRSIEKSFTKKESGQSHSPIEV